MNYNITTFFQALEAFEKLEQDLELSEWTINGVYVWKLLRFQLFREFRTRLGIAEVAHPEKVRLKKSKAQMILDFPKPFLFRNPFLKAGTDTTRIIIPHDRKREYIGKLVDPISYPAWQPPYNKNSIVLDKTSPLNPDPLSGAPSYEVFARFALVFRQAIRVKLKDRDRSRILEIERRFPSGPNTTSLNLEFRVRKATRTFLGLKNVFKLFLKKTRPTYLYCVVGYGKEAPIAAAQELGIKAVEFQHGSMGRGHFGYDFKNWSYVPYFPDLMLAFGETWFSSVYFPDTCKIDPIGYKLFEESINQVKLSINRNPDQLLVLSQGPVANELVAHVAVFAAQRPDWHVLLRPHPSENPAILRDEMNRHAATSNWMVDKEQSLEEHAVSSFVVLGVNSTAILQAFLAGCRVALLDDPNSASYFDQLCSEGNATKVKNGKELAEIIDNIPIGNPRGYFAEPITDVVRHVEGFK